MQDDELLFEAAFVFRSGKNPPKIEEVRRALAQVEGLEAPPRNSQSQLYRYRNPETQVQFDFVLYEPEGNWVGLSFEMGLPRPLYFALEAIPCVVQVARELHLDLEILSPELEHGPMEPTFEWLLDLWQRANRDEVEELEKQGRPLYRFDNQGLETTWEFMLLRAEMARRYSRVKVMVPPIQFVADRKTREVFRAVTWNAIQPVAMGECELVILENPPEPLQSGTVLAVESLRSFAKFAFRDLSQPVVHKLFDKNKALGELPQILAAQPTRPWSDFQWVPSREVVDQDLTPLMEG